LHVTQYNGIAIFFSVEKIIYADVLIFIKQSLFRLTFSGKIIQYRWFVDDI